MPSFSISLSHSLPLSLFLPFSLFLPPSPSLSPSLSISPSLFHSLSLPPSLSLPLPLSFFPPLPLSLFLSSSLPLSCFLSLHVLYYILSSHFMSFVVCSFSHWTVGRSRQEYLYDNMMEWHPIQGVFPGFTSTLTRDNWRSMNDWQRISLLFTSVPPN